jgi:hypothetical protein
MMRPTHKCPHCGTSHGYLERWVASVTQWRDFNGQPVDALVTPQRGGGRKFCAYCKRDITVCVEQWLRDARQN